MHLFIIIATGIFGGLWMFTRWAEWHSGAPDRVSARQQRRVAQAERREARDEARRQDRAKLAAMAAARGAANQAEQVTRKEARRKEWEAKSAQRSADLRRALWRFSCAVAFAAAAAALVIYASYSLPPHKDTIGKISAGPQIAHPKSP